MADHRFRLGHAPRRDGGHPPHRRDHGRGTRRADGRAAGAAARRQGPARPGPVLLSRSRTSSVRTPARRDRASTASASTCAPARSSASPASPATASPSSWRRIAGMPPLDGGSGEVVARRIPPLSAEQLDPYRCCASAASLHVPEDRHRMGLVPPFEACESAILGYPAGRPLRFLKGAFLEHRAAIRRRRARARSRTTTSARATPTAEDRPTSPAATSRSSCSPARSSATPHVLLVGQPTRGVDIGAIEFIHRRLVALRDAGKSPSCWSRSSSTRSCSLVRPDPRHVRRPRSPANAAPPEPSERDPRPADGRHSAMIPAALLPGARSMSASPRASCRPG
jgi:hypothetical protein